MNAPEVISVADAREGLSRALKRFRAGNTTPIVLGSHRKPEAVLVSFPDYISTGTREVKVPHIKLLLGLSRVITTLASAHHLRDVAVFGSVARGDATEHSDVDLLVSTDGQASLFDIARFESEMEELLMHPVHVLARGGLHPQRDKHILNESITI
jgi:predicted nucleotidyltransferase